jgi:hypothetical protein
MSYFPLSDYFKDCIYAKTSCAWPATFMLFRLEVFVKRQAVARYAVNGAAQRIVLRIDINDEKFASGGRKAKNLVPG